MDDTQKAKITRFLDDKTMSDAVYAVLQDAFLHTKIPNNDVHVLAAKSIAIDLLEEGWKLLGRYAAEVKQQPKESGNPGL